MDKIRAEHRVSSAGKYNRHVTDCTFCGYENIDTFGKDNLGFSQPPHQTIIVDKVVAVVYECPKCFERQWSHTTIEGGYYRFLRYKHRLESV